MLALLASAAALAGNDPTQPCDTDPDCLQLPHLEKADFEQIAKRIFTNETGGEFRYLTYWGEGEDFPSFGIGHFIWFPADVDAPFDESFPAMLEFVASHVEDGPDLPEWIASLNPLDAPWPDKQTFDANLTSAELREFREWLSATSSIQARFIAQSFVQRWNARTLSSTDKAEFTTLLKVLMRSSEGLFAVLDYYNFKGLGENPRERYEGAGWGLTQVLSDIVESGCADLDKTSVLDCFSDAAAQRLRQRVLLSPPSRHEERWLEGWLQRVGAYAVRAHGCKK